MSNITEQPAAALIWLAAQFILINERESLQNIEKPETANFYLNNSWSVFKMQLIYVLSMKHFSCACVEIHKDA